MCTSWEFGQPVVKAANSIPDIRRKVRGGNTTFLGGMSPHSCPKSGAQSTPNRQDIHPSHDTRETNEHNIIHPFQFTAYPIMIPHYSYA